jgi:ABC-type phosphate transport system permease subunit
MNCCDGNCNQGKDCPLRTKKESVFSYIIKFFAVIGIYAFIMFVAGYLWASAPLTKERTCTPDLIDRIFK